MQSFTYVMCALQQRGVVHMMCTSVGIFCACKFQIMLESLCSCCYHVLSGLCFIYTHAISSFSLTLTHLVDTSLFFQPHLCSVLNELTPPSSWFHDTFGKLPWGVTPIQRG